MWANYEHSGNDKVIQMGRYDSYPSATEGDFKITAKSGSNAVQDILTIDQTTNAITLHKDVELSTGMSIPTFITHTGDSDTAFGFSANNTFQVSTNSQARIKVDPDGNVGIGTTSPGERLEIRKDIDNDYVRLMLNNEGTNGGASIFFNEGANTMSSIFAAYGTGHRSFNIKNGMINGTLELQTTNSSGTTNDGLIIDGDSNVSIPNGSLTTKGSIAVGTQNTTNSNLSTGGSIAVGTQNTINGNNSLAVGLGNTTNRSGNYALGDRNVVGHPTTTSQGGNSATIGSDNVLHGANSFVAGNNNNISVYISKKVNNHNITHDGDPLHKLMVAFSRKQKFAQSYENGPDFQNHEEAAP